MFAKSSYCLTCYLTVVFVTQGLGMAMARRISASCTILQRTRRGSSQGSDERLPRSPHASTMCLLRGTLLLYSSWLVNSPCHLCCFSEKSAPLPRCITRENSRLHP